MSRKNRFVITLAACVMCCAVSFAQSSSSLTFSELTYDFGNIEEDGGAVAHSFSFVNEGRTPVAVLSATSTCGCTVPTFSRKPVKAGESGVIEVTFDPMNRPGRFDKRIAVSVSGRDEPYRLTISGNVLPRRKSLDELYPAYIGNGLYAETNFHSFAYVEHGKVARTGIGLLNRSNKTLTVNILKKQTGGAFRVAERMPIVLKPEERAEITVETDLASGCGIYGTVTESLVFEIDGRRSDAEVVITGIAIDNRDGWSDNFVPKGELNKNVVKFGAVKHDGMSVSEFFEIVNTGSAPLTIRSVEGVAEGTELSIAAGDTVSAGERRRVRVSVEPSRKGWGPAVENIRIVTDDPARPVRDLKVTMIVGS